MSSKNNTSAEMAGQLPTADEFEKLMIAARAASSRKAVGMIALDIRKIASFADFFLICSGTSTRQVQAIADEIMDQLREERGSRPSSLEGYESAHWILLDYGDLIVHVFLEESREFYQLERLWRDAERVDLSEVDPKPDAR